MVAEVMSGMVQGIEGELITVQADVSDGLPVFYMIGYLSAEVKEAKERVRTALKNCGFHLPPKRISVNLAPADFKKTGTFFDLGIAIALFLALGLLTKESIEQTIFLGELSLDGSLSPVSGVLPVVKKALERGYPRCVVPKENGREAALLEEAEVYSFTNLKEVFSFLTTENSACIPSYFNETIDRNKEKVTDFSEVKGQHSAKRALEIAVAGYHNVLLDGPPGVGKSMLASCIPGIMPEMTIDEKIDVSMIYSVKGMLKRDHFLITGRPFRTPSHSVTMAGMFGGGIVPVPGEISLAHHGVLFLDELPEYKREMIETFRVPLEEHQITLVRKERTLTFPADFILVAAANPCPCGYYPDRRRCRCSSQQIEHYQNKLSGPILDRLDLFVRCEKISYEQLTKEGKEESSEVIQHRIKQAWERQKKRYQDSRTVFNGRMSQKEIEKYCILSEKDREIMKKAFETFDMTGRAYFKVLKIARTIADLEESIKICTRHLEEALLFRRVFLPQKKF